MLRVGLIGAGRVAQCAHLAALAGVTDARVVAVADLRTDFAHAVARRWNIPRVHASHTELIADPAIDAVVIVTQRSQTAGIAAAALAANKHVLSEKPMALSSADARGLVELARSRALTYAIGYMKRHDAGVQRARAFIASGAAGALRAVRAEFEGGDDCSGADWLTTAEPRRDAGFTVGNPAGDVSARSRLDRYFNVFSHTTNLVRFVTGESLVAETATDAAGPARLTGRAGASPFIARFGDRTTGPWYERVWCDFDAGELSLTLPAPFDRAAHAAVTFTAAKGAVTDFSAPGWAFAHQAAAFVHDVRNHAEPLASGHDAIADVILAEAFAGQAL